MRDEGARLMRLWIAPLVHTCLFAIVWLVAYCQSQPLLDGPARWGFILLLFADFPLSAAAFYAMFRGDVRLGVMFWLLAGTAWWFLLSLWFRKRSGQVSSIQST